MLPSLNNLEVINFGDCLVKTEGAKALAKSLRSAVNNLKELNLSFDEINKEGALAIVEALESKDSLEKLELNGGSLVYLRQSFRAFMLYFITSKGSRKANQAAGINAKEANFLRLGYFGPFSFLS